MLPEAAIELLKSPSMYIFKVDPSKTPAIWCHSFIGILLVAFTTHGAASLDK